MMYRTIAGSLSAFVCAVVAANAFTADVAPRGVAPGRDSVAATTGFSEIAPYPQPIYGLAVASDGSSVYGFGGKTFDCCWYEDARRYDPATNSWNPIAKMPDADYLMRADYGGNGKIYVTGGYNDAAGKNFNRIYTIATDSWSSGAAVPVAVYNHGHAFVDGKIYVIGGIVGGHETSHAYAYDVAANTWTEIAAMPQAEFNMAVGVVGRKIYVAGGSTWTDALASLYIYDIATNTWTTGPSMSFGVNAPGAAVVAGKLWVIGGGVPTGLAEFPCQSTSSTASQVFDPAANTWSNGPVLNTARSFGEAATVNGGQTALIVGGCGSTALSDRSVESATVTSDGGLLIGSGLTIGLPSNNFGAIAGNIARYAFANSTTAANQFAIFQTHDPFAATVVKTAITGAGYTYAVFTPAQLAGFNLSSYRVIVLNWDDHSVADFLAPYSAARGALEAYVRAGGVVWVQAAIQGAAGDNFTMPFGFEENWGTANSDYVADPNNAMIAGAPNPLTGNAASRAFFSGAPKGPGGHTVVEAVTAGGPPVLYEFRVRRVTFDTNADLRTDWTVFRPSSGVWYSALSNGGATETTLGTAGDIDVMGDYDGDGVGDLAVFRPSDGTWRILRSRDHAMQIVYWGGNGDIPMAGDFNGDGLDDEIIWRPNAGVWFVNLSGGGTFTLGWGINGDMPLVGDFNGDRRDDLAIFRPTSGVWYIALAGGGTTIVGWGTPSDIPVVGDFDGDGKSDIVVFRPSSGTWFVLRSSGGAIAAGWGTSGDVPVSGDWDGDGRADFTVWRPSNGVWYTQFAVGGFGAVSWGTATDKPTGRRPGS